MNKSVNHELLSGKPSGSVTYTVNAGANVFPGKVMSDKAFVRVLDGELVIFQEFRGDDKVAVSVGSVDKVDSQIV
jgi:hypothetical protein